MKSVHRVYVFCFILHFFLFQCRNAFSFCGFTKVLSSWMHSLLSTAVVTAITIHLYAFAYMAKPFDDAASSFGGTCEWMNVALSDIENPASRYVSAATLLIWITKWKQAAELMQCADKSRQRSVQSQSFIFFHCRTTSRLFCKFTSLLKCDVL